MVHHDASRLRTTWPTKTPTRKPALERMTEAYGPSDLIKMLGEQTDWGFRVSSIRQDIQKSAMTVPVVAPIPNQFGFEPPMRVIGRVYHHQSKVWNQRPRVLLVVVWLIRGAFCWASSRQSGLYPSGLR